VYRAIGQVKSKKWVGCTLLFTFVAFCCAFCLVRFGCWNWLGFWICIACCCCVWWWLFLSADLVGGVIVAYGWYVLVKV